MSIDENVKAGVQAREIIAFIDSFQYTSKHFWDILYYYTLSKVDKVQQSNMVRMSEEEAAKFEKQCITFGAHEGKEIREIPQEYLDWLADSFVKDMTSKDSFKLLLARYCQSHRAHIRRDR